MKHTEICHIVIDTTRSETKIDTCENLAFCCKRFNTKSLFLHDLLLINSSSYLSRFSVDDHHTMVQPLPCSPLLFHVSTKSLQQELFLGRWF